MSQAVNESLQAGRDATKRYAWRKAFDLLSAADASTGLLPEDLVGLAEAAWWIGRLDRCVDARERAYALYLEGGNRQRAAYVALELAHDYSTKLAQSIAAGWLSRAERLLANEPESVEHGYLARAHRTTASNRGDLDGALECANRTVEIGTRFGDRDLMALGLHDQGRALVAMGRVAEGMALMDEATVAAVGGELSPSATGIIYCNIISTCENLADIRRAGEWTEAAKRWCERQSISGFPGICRVHRAEIMRLRGAWAEAEQEARRACTELHDSGLLSFAGEGFYEVGEIRLRMGDLAAAEDAFRQAHELGREPQPGLSILRLLQGNIEAAAISIKRALADESWDRLARARLLPAQVEIAIAAGDLDSARSAADEMETIAKAYETPALQAYAQCARGALQLAEGDAAAAVRSIRRGWHLWQDLDVPYEAARARMLLAAAYQAQGDREAAALELETAKSAFERLGAIPDVRRASDLLGMAAVVRSTSIVQGIRTFMFTDIVKSTALVEAIGDDAWMDVLRWHDATLRSLFASHGGEEVDHTGDGFFVAFETGSAAVECAVTIQRALAEHRRTQGFAPQVRIGLHTAKATRQGRDYKGKGVHEAARIAALAEGEQIVASRDTFAGAPARFAVSKPHTVTLKGISKPIEVAIIEWR